MIKCMQITPFIPRVKHAIGKSQLYEISEDQADGDSGESSDDPEYNPIEMAFTDSSSGNDNEDEFLDQHK